MDFTERVKSLTQDKLLPKVVDNVLDSNVIFARVVGGNAMPWRGESMKRAIRYTQSTTGGSFSGLDTFSTSATETTIRLSYDIRGYYQSVVIPGIEKAVNSITETQVVDLVKFKMQEAEADLIDGVGDALYSDGTGNSNKDFLGLGAIVDDGTDVSTIGGQSRTTYSVLDATRTASGGTLTLDKLSTLYSACAQGSQARYNPTLIISNEAVWNLYESLLTPTIRLNYQMEGYPVVTRRSRGVVRGAEVKGGMGFRALTYKGVPWVADEKSTAQTVWMINENYLEWYGLNAPDLQKITLGTDSLDSPLDEAPSEFGGFNWTGLKVPTNQFGEVGQIILLGNFVSWRPKSHGRLTGVTGV